MALNTQNDVAARNAGVDAIVALANTGYLRIYDGTQPAAGGAATTKLAELRFGATAFGAAAAGVATANAITSDSSADATGTATWFRVLKSDGTTILWDGSIGTSGCNLNLNSTAIQVGAQVSVSAMTYSIAAQGN